MPKALSQRSSRAARKGNYEVYHPARGERDHVTDDSTLPYSSTKSFLDRVSADRHHQQFSHLPVDQQIDQIVKPLRRLRVSPAKVVPHIPKPQYRTSLEDQLREIEELADEARARLKARRAERAAAKKAKPTLIQRLGEAPPTTQKPIKYIDFTKKTTEEYTAVLITRFSATLTRLGPVFTSVSLRDHLSREQNTHLDNFARELNWVALNLEEHGASWDRKDLDGVKWVCETIRELDFTHFKAKFLWISRQVINLYKGNYLAWVDKNL